MRLLATFMVAGLVCFTGCNGCNGKERTARGPGDNKLTLEVPDDLAVTQGQTEEFEIEVERTGFDAAVELEFSDIPSGVQVVGEKRIAQGKEEAKLLLKAAAVAEPRKGMIKVTAKGGGASVSAQMPITVKAGEAAKGE